MCIPKMPFLWFLFHICLLICTLPTIKKDLRYLSVPCGKFSLNFYMGYQNYQTKCIEVMPNKYNSLAFLETCTLEF